MIDHILCLRVAWEKSKGSGKFICVVFIDFTKAFDMVPKKTLWDRLVTIGVPKDLLAAVIKIYERVYMKLSATQSQ